MSMSSNHIKLLQTIIKHIPYQSHKDTAELDDFSLVADSLLPASILSPLTAS